MATTTTARKPLTDAQLQELMGLIKGADTVELKLTIPASGMRSARSSLGIDPLDAQIRQVFFFDTPDLKLNKRGVVVRARRIQGKPHDSVVKLRPVVPDHLPPELRKSGGVGVDEELRRRVRDLGRCRGRPGDPEAVLEAAASLLRRPRPRRAGAR